MGFGPVSLGSNPNIPAKRLLGSTDRAFASEAKDYVFESRRGHTTKYSI